MALDRLSDLCRRAIDVPHDDLEATLGALRYLTEGEREHAARCYASLIGERELPASVGAKHTLAPRIEPKNDMAQVKRNATARRRLEEMRDELTGDS